MINRNLNKEALLLLLIGSFAFFCCNQTIYAQLEVTFPTQKSSDFDTAAPGYCWYNQMQLDQISQHIPLDKTIIVIARLGDRDRRVDLSKRRIQNVRAYLTDGVAKEFRRSVNSIIVAEGERVVGHGRIEFYLDGRLITVLKAFTNNDLGVAECYAGTDGDPWCKTARQKLFYPCKDYAKSKPTKTKSKKSK